MPRVAGTRLAGLPRALEPGQVDQLLASCDRDTAGTGGRGRTRFGEAGYHLVALRGSPCSQPASIRQQSRTRTPDLKLKEQALERTRPVTTKPGRYRPSDSLLAFLESL